MDLSDWEKALIGFILRKRLKILKWVRLQDIKQNL